MRKFEVYHVLVLILTLLILGGFVWLFFFFKRPVVSPLLLKARTYYEEVVSNKAKDKNIKLLSAFDYEDGYTTILTANFLKTGYPVFCHYFDKNRRVIPDASRQISMFTETTARCPKNRNINSEFIALSYSFRKSSKLVPIPIKKHQFFEKKHELVVCVELELQPNWLELISFIEYHRKLNIPYFYFTTIDLDEYNRRILDDYKRLGIAYVNSMRSPGNLNNPKIYNELKSIQRTNCLFQSRLNAKLVTFLRIDERVANIPFFIENLKSDNITETRLVTKTIQIKERLKKFTNETDIVKTIENLDYKKHVQFRKVIDPSRIESLKEISEDFVYKKASTYYPLLPDDVLSSVVTRANYNYDTRPIYCEEFDIEVLSWCPVNVYHCRFRDEQSKKNIMEKREEARKIRYKQETIRW